MGVPLPIIFLIACMMTLFAVVSFIVYKKRVTFFAPQTIDPKSTKRDDST